MVHMCTRAMPGVGSGMDLAWIWCGSSPDLRCLGPGGRHLDHRYPCCKAEGLLLTVLNEYRLDLDNTQARSLQANLP